ncbi:MAG: aminoglycoside phosphotransferase [Saprospiraceae bacterium]|nr:MAG: aminoglycoside phosphotransferase [Saprospiraceae bacterium]
MPQNPINTDKATSIRKGEEFDIASLQKFLQQHLGGGNGQLVLEQFPGGASNLTYLIHLGDQQLVLRRPPFGANIKSAHDMGREYRVLSALSKSYDKAPKPLLYSEDTAIIGAPFYVMERIEGVILRADGGAAKSLEKSVVYDIAEALMDTLAQLHALDYQEIGLGQLGKPEGYVARQISGWTKRYFKAKTDEVPALEKAAKWLSENLPKETAAALIHNDFKHDNVVLDPNDLTNVIAILDWEMCTIGDPLMDLGTTLGYWSNPNDPDLLRLSFPNPSILPGNPSRSELLELYARKSGRDVGNFVFYYVYGLFKIAVIVQQIYHRYKHGFTQDKRFAQMDKLVAGFGQMAARAIERQRVDDLF